MIGRRAIAGLALLSLAGAPAFADESLLDTLGKATGLIAPPVDPPDFVKASRPSGEAAEVPVFAPPEEPRSKVKTPAELKAMDADLEGAAGAPKPAKPKRKPDSRR